MRITYGYKDKVKIEEKYTNGICENCGHTVDKYLTVRKRVYNICYIPVFSKTMERGIMCECCGNIESISKDEYKAAKASFKK